MICIIRNYSFTQIGFTHNLMFNEFFYNLKQILKYHVYKIQSTLIFL